MKKKITEKELKKYVDEYFDKYMCVSFEDFIENWEDTTKIKDFYYKEANKYNDIVEKAIEYIEERQVGLNIYGIKPLLKILRGEDNEDN